MSGWNWCGWAVLWIAGVGVCFRRAALLLGVAIASAPVGAGSDAATSTSRVVVRLGDSDPATSDRRVWVVRHAPASPRQVIVEGRAVVGGAGGREVAFDLEPGSYEIVSLDADPWSLPTRSDVRLFQGESPTVVLPVVAGDESGWQVSELDVDSRPPGSLSRRELDIVEWAESPCVGSADAAPASTGGWRDLGIRLTAFDEVFAAWNHDPTAPFAGLVERGSTELAVPFRSLMGAAPATGSNADARVITNGPLIDLWVNREPAGGRVPPAFGRAHCRIRVRAPAWMPLDRVAVLVNGDVIETFDLRLTGERVRLDTRVSLDVERDAWIAVVAVSDEPMPALATSQRSTELGFVLTLPVWVDVDNDGVWTSLVEHASGFLAGAPAARDIGAQWGASGPNGRVALLAAARSLDAGGRVGMRGLQAIDLHALGLSDASGLVRAAAIRGVTNSIVQGGPDADRWRRLVEFAVGMGCDERVDAAAASVGVTGGDP